MLPPSVVSQAVLTSWLLNFVRGIFGSLGPKLHQGPLNSRQEQFPPTCTQTPILHLLYFPATLLLSAATFSRKPGSPHLLVVKFPAHTSHPLNFVLRVIKITTVFHKLPFRTGIPILSILFFNVF